MLVIGGPTAKRWYQRRPTLVIVTIALGLLAYFAADVRRITADAYHDRRQQRALRQAQAFLASNDRANAALALQVALQANPANADAWRTAAEVLERAGDPRALELRRQLLRTDPQSLDALLAFVGAALRFNDAAEAEAALAQVPAEREGEPAVLKLRAALLVAQGKPAAARRTLERLATLEPENATMRFNFATLELRQGDAASRIRARAALDRWAESDRTALRAPALRELARDAIARGDTAAALALTEQLVSLREATFADELLRLDLLGATAAPETAAAQDAVARRAAAGPDTAAAYVTWLMMRHRANEAWAWLQSLASATRRASPVAAAAADCLGALEQWDAMSRALIDGAWGPVRADAIRKAFSARMEGRADPAGIARAWSQALELAGPDLPTLRVLLRVASLWGWREPAEQTLFALVARDPKQTWAFRALVSSAYARRDAGRLQAAYDAWHRACPQDARVAGDWAMLTLLQEPSTAPSEAKDTARRLHAATPDDAYFATTHAFACYQSGRTKDAIAVMERLRPGDLDVPGRALYFGVFLAADAQAERARQALARAAHANLLPAERDLLAKALARVAQQAGPESRL